jgi:hypothetical protein
MDRYPFRDLPNHQVWSIFSPFSTEVRSHPRNGSHFPVNRWTAFISITALMVDDYNNKVHLMDLFLSSLANAMFADPDLKETNHVPSHRIDY